MTPTRTMTTNMAIPTTAATAMTRTMTTRTIMIAEDDDGNMTKTMT